MADDHQTSLSSNDMTTNTRNTQSNTLAVETYITATLLQQDFPPLEGVPSLQQHQKIAKENAQAWSVVRGKLYQTNEDLLAYSNEFNNFYGTLYDNALKIDNDKAARATLIQGLGILQNDVGRYQSNSQIAYDTLVDYQKKLNQDQNNLASDNSLINSQYEGDKGLLVQYQEKIDADRKAMSKDLSMIAGGSTMDVVGGLMIAVGVLGEIATAGISTTLVVGGLAVVAGGSTMIGLSAKDYDEKSKDLAETTSKLAAVSAEITLAHTLLGTTSDLNELAKQALAALNALNMSWTILLNDFNIVISALEAINPDYPSVFVCSLLKTAKDDWGLVNDAALTIRRQIINPEVNTTAVQNGTLPQSYNGNTSLSTTRTRKTITNNVMASSRAISTTQNSTADAASSLSDSLNNLNSVTHNLLSQYQSLPSTANAPKDVQNNFNAIGSDIPLVNSSVAQLTKDLTDLGNYSAPLAQLAAQNPVDVSAAKLLFAQISKTTSDIQKGSATASDNSLQKLTNDTTNADSSLKTWISSINNSIAADQSTIDSLNQQLKSLEKQKDDIKKDWWYCVLGAVACGISAAVIAGKMDDINDNISKERGQLSAENAELDNSVHLLQSVTSLEISAGTAASYSNSIYASLQMISSDLGNVATSSSNDVVEAFVKSQALYLAASLALLSPKASAKSISRKSVPSFAPKIPAKTLLAVTEVPADDELIEVLRDFTAQLMLFEQSIDLILYQPPISLTLDNSGLILQDEKDVQTHAFNWRIGDRGLTYGILQQFSSTNALLANFLNMTIDFIQQNDIPNAIMGIKASIPMVSTLIDYILQSQNTLLLGSGRDFENDNAHFQVVSSILSQSFEGDKGQLAQLQNQLENLRTTIDQNNKTIADGATKTVAKLLLTETVAVGLAFGLGAIAIPAAAEGAAELTVLYTKIAQGVVKGSSEAAKSFATDTFKETITADNSNFMEDANKTLEAYGDTLKTLDRAMSDAGVIYTLIGNVSATYESFYSFSHGISRTVPPLKQFKSYLNNIPSMLDAGQTSESISYLQNAITLSNHVGSASQQFLDSLLSTSTSAPTKQ